MSAVGTEECPNRLSHQEFERPGFQIEASQSSKARDEQAAIRQERDGFLISFPSPGSKVFTSPAVQVKNANDVASSAIHGPISSNSPSRGIEGHRVHPPLEPP